MNKRNAIRFAALVVILLLLAVLLYFRFRPEEEPVQNLSPICIQGLYPGGDRLWLVRGSPDHIPGEYELYALAEDGTETYITPFPASQVIWNREREVFHYLAQTRLRTFDPATEQEQTQPIQHEYLHLCTAEGETVFAQRELYGTVAALSLSDASERELSVAGRVVAVEDGRLLVWDDASQQLICHDYAADAVIWRVDLPDHPLVCAIGGDLYLGQQSGGPLYRIPDFTQSGQLLETGVNARPRAMADGGGYLVYALRLSSRDVELWALYPDGSRAEVGTWPGPHYEDEMAITLAVYGGQVYCAVQAEEDWFCCPLPGA